MDDSVVAIFCSDIHLSARAPVARRGEKDWYAAMKRPLKYLAKLAKELPIICAGDIFDVWNSPAELINFAILELPHMYAIPGQHDLPHHQLDKVHRSAYGTLDLVEVIRSLDSDTGIGSERAVCVLWPFPWGTELHTLEGMMDIVQWDATNYRMDCKVFHIAVVHKYIWQSKKNSYPGAPTDAHIDVICKQLEGFDLAVFGDNHKGFLVTDTKPQILNCGGFMRRKADEIDYRPAVGLLHKSGKVEQHFLPLDNEVIEAVEEPNKIGEADFSEFMDRLTSLGADPLDFVELLEQAARKEEKNVEEVLTETIAHIRGEGT